MYVPRLNAPGRAPSARALGAGYVVGRRLTFNNLIDYFVRSIPSDIKSAVAFFKMDFSRSRRSTRASSS